MSKEFAIGTEKTLDPAFPRILRVPRHHDVGRRLENRQIRLLLHRRPARFAPVLVSHRYIDLLIKGERLNLHAGPECKGPLHNDCRDFVSVFIEVGHHEHFEGRGIDKFHSSLTG